MNTTTPPQPPTNLTKCAAAFTVRGSIKQSTIALEPEHKDSLLVLRQFLLGSGGVRAALYYLVFSDGEKKKEREHPGSRGPSTVELVRLTVTVNDWPEVSPSSQIVLGFFPSHGCYHFKDI